MTARALPAAAITAAGVGLMAVSASPLAACTAKIAPVKVVLP